MNTQQSRKTEQPHAESPLFNDTVDVQRFFPGGKRQEILDKLLRSIAEAVPIVTLTGDEGSGKTMMCRMVEYSLSPDYVTVFFPRTVDSFEDVVRVVASRMKIEPAVAVGDIPTLLQAIADKLRGRNGRLLIIFDEAEKIYLATLERVRKMLDQMNASGLLLQIVLSGRKGLHGNFKNLALCNFLEVEERHIALEPLDLEETCAYLRYALPDGEQSEKHPRLTREVSEKIFSASGGNFRMIHAEAEKSLQSLAPDTSFLVLLDNVQEVEKKSRPRRRTKAVEKKKIQYGRRELAWAGGVICCIFLVFFLLRPAQKVDVKPESSSETKKQILVSQPESQELLPEKSIEKSSDVQVENNAGNKKVIASSEALQPEVAVQDTPPEKAESALTSAPEKKQAAVQVEQRGPEEKKEERSEAPEKAEDSAATDNEKSAATVDTAPVVELKKENQAAPVAIAQQARIRKEETPLPAEAGKTVQVSEGQAADSQKTASLVTPEKEEAVVPPVEEQPAKQEKEPSAETIQVIQTAESKKEEIPPVQATVAERELEAVSLPVQMIKAREIVKYRERMQSSAEVETPKEDVQSGDSRENKIAKIKLEQPAKIKPEVQNEPKVTALKAPPVVAQVAEKQKAGKEVTAEKNTPTPVKKSENGDRMISSRIAAGTPWLLGLKDDRYTVQLMVITDSADEKNLKKMLAQDSFKGQADKIYILRKEQAPDVKFVFYGEYPTMTDARNARNTLPEALRGTKPYAMSVKGAVRKVQEEE